MTAGKLTVFDRGGANGVTIEHWGARVSWQINGPGQLSVFVAADTARRYGAQGINWAGAKWVLFEHPDLPDWGGVVTRPRWTPGVYELGCESFHVLMRMRRVPRVYEQQPAPAGALAVRAFSDVQADDHMFIVSFDADEEGAVVPVAGRGGDLADDHFRQLASASGQEWSVNAKREAEWRVRLGEDKTGSLILTYPGEIVDYAYEGDLWTVRNDIEGVATDARQDRSAYETARHTDSVRAIGAYQQSIRYPSAVGKATLRPLISRDLHRWAWPAETMDLKVANLAHVWARYHIGDSFLARIPEANVTRKVRVLARSVDVEEQIDSLGVEVEGEADGWT